MEEGGSWNGHELADGKIDGGREETGRGGEGVRSFRGNTCKRCQRI